MGMYDYIEFEGELYQTKDFENEMRTYYLSNDRLLKSVGYFESVPQSERPFPNEPEASLLGMCGSIKWIETERQDMNYHGMLTFGDESITFSAKFTNGIVVEMGKILHK
jgi:hypothetical protein